MFRLIFCRSIHVTRASMAVSRTSALANLRKSTGYPLTNCKKALELFPDDLSKAEEWLHAEAKSKGWSKWAKIQERNATQGLIGVCSKDNVGVMVEINCETDFVSRNSEFQHLVGKMLSGCISYAAVHLDQENDITKAVLDESQLSAIHCETSTLGELLVAAAMKFNEKTVAKRAVLLKVPDEVLLNSLTHPTVVCSNLTGASLGKYGVLLASKEDKTDTTEDTSALRLNMCHHIIGMNPLSVGQLTDKDIAKFSEETSDESEISENIQPEQNTENVLVEQNTETVLVKQNTENLLVERNTENVQVEQNAQLENIHVPDDSNTEDQETIEVQLKESSETELLFQSYLMDPSVTVGEILFKSGINVLSFERFECGETSEESSDVAVAANS